MVCSKCGQKLKVGVKFCTKCGANFKNPLILLPLPIISLVLSLIGIIIVILVFRIGVVLNYPLGAIGYLLLYLSLPVALLGQFKQKNLLGFIFGLIPCAYLLIEQVYFVITNFMY